MTTEWLDVWRWGVAVIGVGVSAVFDLRHRRIPNGVLVFMALGAALAAVCTSLVNGALAPVLRAASGGVVSGLVPLLLWRFHLLGAGDVKLCAVVGTLVGVRSGLACASVAFTVGSVSAVLLAAYHGRLTWQRPPPSVGLASARLLPRSAWGRLHASLRPSLVQTLPFAPALFISLIGVMAFVWLLGGRG